MFLCNPNAKYEPNGGRYLQILSGKDLYKQIIVFSIKDTDTFDGDDIFPANLLNIFVQYRLGEMRTTDIKWKNWNNAPLRLWQTQLNFVVWCTSSACGISSEHLNYKIHSMIQSLYQFHVYITMSNEFGKDYRFVYPKKMILTLLKILIAE